MTAATKKGHVPLCSTPGDKEVRTYKTTSVLLNNSSNARQSFGIGSIRKSPGSIVSFAVPVARQLWTPLASGGNAGTGPIRSPSPVF